MAEYAGSTDPITMLHMAIQRMDEKAEKTNEVLFAKLDKTNEKVDKLSEIVSQQAILFEKFATMEANHKTSIERIHSRIDKHEAEEHKRYTAMLEKIEKVEGYMHGEGCPAHKSFQVVREHEIKGWIQRAGSIEDKIWKIEEKVDVIEKAPLKALHRVAIAALGAIGTGIGLWVLIKFGIEVDTK